MKRREFFKTAAACGVASTLPIASAQDKKENAAMTRSLSFNRPEPAKATCSTELLGGTGEKVSAIGLGGFHIARHGLSEHETIRLVRSAIDRGITFMDNCWDYNEGESENRDG